MSPRQRPERRGVYVRMRADLVEALDETSTELTVSRNKLIEIAVEEYLRRMELTTVHRL